jgi:uncharacterized protein YlaN (UPF0358 family)
VVSLEDAQQMLSTFERILSGWLSDIACHCAQLQRPEGTHAGPLSRVYAKDLLWTIRGHVVSLEDAQQMLSTFERILSGFAQDPRHKELPKIFKQRAIGIFTICLF